MELKREPTQLKPSSFKIVAKHTKTLSLFLQVTTYAMIQGLQQETAMNLQTLGIFSILSYLAIAFVQGLHLFGKLKTVRSWYFTGSFFSLLAHGFVLYKLIDTPMGQNMDWLIMLSFTLWLMNLLTFMISVRAPMMELCVLTYPLSALILGLGLFTGHHEALSKTPPQALMHIFISLFAMSLLTLASLQAILLALQNTLLKQHRPSVMLRILPPLQTMESMLFIILWSGLIFLSASLLSGFFFLSWQEHIAYPKTILAIIAWISLALLMIGRVIFGWRGPTAIRWTLSSTIFAVLSYFGTKALLL
ncbi:MAG: cytochrome c biogenesis protein CcsA [Proteobacteria bacterium]|nr:cytochrome c biogenesis protein CcsA [Pseudomonadota bacterium]